MSALAGGIADPGAYNTDTRKLLAWGRRTTNKTGITTEVEVLRLDGVAALSGHFIRVDVTPVRLTAVATDVTALIKYATDGSNATTSSLTMRASVFGSTAAVSACFPAWFAVYTPPADQTLSLLFTLQAGSSISMTGADTSLPLDILVWDCGPDTGDIGFVI